MEPRQIERPRSKLRQTPAVSKKGPPPFRWSAGWFPLRSSTITVPGAENCNCRTLLPVSAQTISSGSTGADGALNLTTPGAIVFDPTALGLDADADNVFHFTTINIGAGVTVKLTSARLKGRSVIWLASGAVQISGI